MLTRIPGVGKRLAERLAVELKEKLDDLVTAMQPEADSSVRAKVPATDDVLSALVNLGYARPAALKAIDIAIARDAATGGHFDSLFRAQRSSIFVSSSSLKLDYSEPPPSGRLISVDELPDTPGAARPLLRVEVFKSDGVDPLHPKCVQIVDL